MLKTSTELVSFNVIRVWITVDAIRKEIREWFENSLIGYDVHDAGEMEIPIDWFMEVMDELGDLTVLSVDAITSIGGILSIIENGEHDIAGIIFTKKEEDGMEDPYE